MNINLSSILNQLIDCLLNVGEIKLSTLTTIIKQLSKENLITLAHQYQAATGYSLQYQFAQAVNSNYMLFEILVQQKHSIQTQLLNNQNAFRPNLFIYFVVILNSQLQNQQLIQEYYIQTGKTLIQTIYQYCSNNKLVQRLLVSKLAQTDSLYQHDDEQYRYYSNLVISQSNYSQEVESAIVYILAFTQENQNEFKQQLLNSHKKLDQILSQLNLDEIQKFYINLSLSEEKVCFLFHYLLGSNMSPSTDTDVQLIEQTNDVHNSFNILLIHLFCNVYGEINLSILKQKYLEMYGKDIQQQILLKSGQIWEVLASFFR